MPTTELLREYHSADRRTCVTLLKLPGGSIHLFRYEILAVETEQEYSTPVWLGSFDTVEEAERQAAAELDATAILAS